MYFFLGNSLLMLALVASLSSVLQTYTLLNNGFYHWWWRSFLLGACAGIYLFLVSAFIY